MSAAATPYIGAAIVGNDGAASPAQGAAIAGLSMLLSGAVAGALGQNAAGAAASAENEALNNCTVHDCWQKVVDAWNSASGTATDAFNQIALHLPDNVVAATTAGADVPAMESATNLDLLKGAANVALNVSTFSLPGMPDYTPYFQYSNPAVGEIGELASRVRPIRKWFRWLTRNNRVLYNPAADLDLPKAEERLPKHVLTIEEVERVLNLPDTTTALGVRDRAMLETLYSTGIRRIEIIGCSSATSIMSAAR